MREQKILTDFNFFTLSNAKHGESIVIGLAACSTSKGYQVKTYGTHGLN